MMKMQMCEPRVLQSACALLSDDYDSDDNNNMMMAISSKQNAC